MKANAQQYKFAEKLYSKYGAGAVYDYARQIRISSWSFCKPCDARTPDCDDDSCLVCGSAKQNFPVFTQSEV